MCVCMCVCLSVSLGKTQKGLNFHEFPPMSAILSVVTVPRPDTTRVLATTATSHGTVVLGGGHGNSAAHLWCLGLSAGDSNPWTRSVTRSQGPFNGMLLKHQYQGDARGQSAERAGPQGLGQKRKECFTMFVNLFVLARGGGRPLGGRGN